MCSIYLPERDHQPSSHVIVMEKEKHTTKVTRSNVYYKRANISEMVPDSGQITTDN